jgi:electron transfer flavoprotein alpha/beta subunit
MYNLSNAMRLYYNLYPKSLVPLWKVDDQIKETQENNMDIIRNPDDELAIATERAANAARDRITDHNQIAAMVGANTSKAAIEYARKLGIAEAALVTISAYADIPGTDPLATLREISDLAHSALVKTERRKAGLTALQHHQKYMEDH